MHGILKDFYLGHVCIASGCSPQSVHRCASQLYCDLLKFSMKYFNLNVFDYVGWKSLWFRVAKPRKENENIRPKCLKSTITVCVVHTNIHIARLHDRNNNKIVHLMLQLFVGFLISFSFLLGSVFVLIRIYHWH